MIDFSKYKKNLSVDAFISIVPKDIFKDLDDDTKERLKNGISFVDIYFSFGLQIRNKYIYPYLEKRKFCGKKSVDADNLSIMIVNRIIKKSGGKISYI